jgi:hypothetical protein
MLEYDTRLFLRDAGKPFDKLMDGRIVFQVLEKRGNWHARSAKYPRATNASGVTLDRSA